VIGDLDNPLWQFSLAVYAQPGVPAACLHLQDTFDVDVNLLLCAAWLGAAQGVLLTPSDLVQLDEHVAAFRNTLIRPLRRVRRELKSADAGAYATIKAAELTLEQIEHSQLFAYAVKLKQSVASPGELLATNVANYLAQKGAPVDLADALLAAARTYRSFGR
jgi:uncharacterized protein (TIGR02444 family)